MLILLCLMVLDSSFIVAILRESLVPLGGERFLICRHKVVISAVFVGVLIAILLLRTTRVVLGFPVRLLLLLLLLVLLLTPGEFSFLSRPDNLVIVVFSVRVFILLLLQTLLGLFTGGPCDLVRIRGGLVFF